MKKFKVLSNEETASSGTSLQGYINATYSQLLETLGEPTYNEPSGDDKVQVEWVVEFNDNIFTIYDWKTGSREYTENELMEFNVGGTIPAYDFINELESQINK
jgi:hypothetical protein